MPSSWKWPCVVWKEYVPAGRSVVVPSLHEIAWRAGPRRIGGVLAPEATSWAKVKSLTNGPSPTLIGPVVKRRHSLALKPPTAVGAASSAVHETGSWPATDAGGLAVSGG